MASVWRHPGLSGAEATTLINGNRDTPLSPRTILTVLSRLEAKGFLSHVVDGRAYRYTAVVLESEFVEWHAQRAITDLLKRYGDDAVISGLLGAPSVDPDALARLDELLERSRERKT
jgi:predicted transcriptional regulator